MTTNTKFRSGSKEAPTEPFKRAVTACLRAIAKTPARRGCRSRRAR